jgi:hypothetical protein
MLRGEIEREFAQCLTNSIENDVFDYYDEATIISLKDGILNHSYTYSQQKDTLMHYKRCLARIKKKHGAIDFDSDPDNENGKIINLDIGIRNGKREYMAIFFEPLENKRFKIYHFKVDENKTKL